MNGSDCGKEMHIGIKATGKDNLLAFVGGTSMKMVYNSECIKQAEIKLLTVHTKLRQKRMVPILIKEIHRRFNLRHSRNRDRIKQTTELEETN